MPRASRQYCIRRQAYSVIGRAPSFYRYHLPGCCRPAPGSDGRAVLHARITSPDARPTFGQTKGSALGRACGHTTDERRPPSDADNM